ncbi:MAG: hypothetical protein WD063_04135 [Pirellulales bacterium]
MSYFIAWAILFVLTFVCLIVFPALSIGAIGAFGLGSLFLVTQTVNLLLAKARVLKKGEQPLLFGLLTLIAWNPTDGIVILRNKNVHYVDDNLHDGGGIKLICPLLGEEVALRVPLEPQSLVFDDTDVLTKEYLPLHIRGTMKWRIISLEHFYLLVSTELHEADDKKRHATVYPHGSRPSSRDETSSGAKKLALAEEWLRWTAEEQTRIVISRLSTGLLVAHQIAADLPPGMIEAGMPRADQGQSAVPSATGKYQTATDNLAARIYTAIAESVTQYGIDIHEVTLQEVRLPPEIHRQCVEACKAAYIPFIAQKQALEKKMELQAEADVIGAEAVAAREIVGAAPAFSLVDVLAHVVANNPALARRAPP